MLLGAAIIPQYNVISKKYSGTANKDSLRKSPEQYQLSDVKRRKCGSAARFKRKGAGEGVRKGTVTYFCRIIKFRDGRKRRAVTAVCRFRMRPSSSFAFVAFAFVSWHERNP